MGLAGSWAAGAVLVDGDEPARFAQVTTRRAVIFTGGLPVRLPDHRDGWRWEPYAVDGADVEAARQQLQRLMRDAEADIAEADVGVFNAQDLPGPACSITETANGGVTVNLGNKDIRVSLTGKSINAYKGEKNAFGQYGWTQLFTLATE